MSQDNHSLEALISPGALTNFPKTLPAPLSNQRTVFTMYGRNALFLGLLSLRECTMKRKILLPALNCGVEINAIRAADFEVDFYNLQSTDLQCSSDEIEGKINDHTAAVVITHYFGFAQLCVKKLSEICRRHNVALIEDCAHALGSSLEGQPLGSLGDISIFSIRKSLPLPHGGALILNNPDLPLPEAVRPSSDAIDFDLLVYFVQRAGIVQPGVPIDVIYQSLGKKVDPFGARLEDYGGYTLGLPALTRVLIDSLDVASHLSLRRSAFNRYCAYFRTRRPHAISPLFVDCSEEVCPPFFPIVTSMNSEVCHKALSVMGDRAPVPFWSTNHSAQPQDYAEILKMKERLMILPLADPLEPVELNNMLQILEKRS